MNIVSDAIRREKEYSGIIGTIAEQLNLSTPHPARIIGLYEGAKTAFFASVIADVKKSGYTGSLLIVPDEKEALKAFNSLSELGLTSLIYPFRDFIFHNITASHEYEHERLNVLAAIMNGEYDTVIATPDAALQYTMPREVLSRSVRTIKSNDTCSLEELVRFLCGSGYVRTETVDGAGQFSVRGGIIDIYPPNAQYPVRIELFGDEIDSMGLFDIITQRRTETVESIQLTPAREIVISEEVRKSLVHTVSAQLRRTTDGHAKELLNAEAEALNTGTELRFIDKYICAVYPQKECLLDYFGRDTVLLIQEYSAVSERLHSYEWHQKQTITNLLEESAVSPKLAEFGKWETDFSFYTANHAGAITDTFMNSIADMRLAGIFSITTRQTVSYSDNYELLKEDLGAYIRGGYSTVLLCENETMAKNLQTILENDGINSVAAHDAEPAPGTPVITWGVNVSGYDLIVNKFVLMSLYASNSYSRISAASKRRKAVKRSKQERIMSYTDLEPGDYVVHVNHGIGMYLGMETVTVNNITKDCIKIKYAGTDMLYIPCNQLEAISKYIGARAEDGTLKLSKMGGAEWGRAKSKVKAAAKEMAKELIKLYAERQRREGFAFRPDDEMQRDFEEAFEYEETEGQEVAIREVKDDMESSHPMDRLLCGDVGFGKTEVALRAAFKAVISGKQAAFLVPTTILALQHYQTLLSRVRGFPVNVDMLSRFRSPKQQAETLRRLRRGEIDILVGTHRIVSKDVVFRDLGLVIIDEEQRFGVAHKEKLKQIAGNVDVLTLTATPIPRTLNMAMSGIRDMSILEEAPGDRVPVQTYVLEYDDLIIAEAIKKELRRGGQVFYLYNRIETINAVFNKVSAMVPDARIMIAHGRMDKDELSDIWRSMLSGEVDILISTAIIESGIDVPNANTLIVENSDKLGLSQLHQLRGRVGRSSRRAYAYLTYPKGAVLTEIAAKRLTAIRDYTEFGSGFRIALRDLEIRGAGNLLGSEQHGHIETVGYDLYMRLLNEAILEEKGEVIKKKTECNVDMDCDAYIPESYIRSPVQRIDIYKKISLIENEEDLRDVADEILDRFGNMPKVVNDLLKIALIRSFGSECDITRIKRREGSVLIYPGKIDVRLWTLTASEYNGKLLISLDLHPYVSCRIRKDDKPLDTLIEIFKKYIQFKNENK